MKVLAHVHRYMDDSICGGERMLHGIFTALQNRGHECIVACKDGGYRHGDVQTVDFSTDPDIYGWADVVITHLGKRGEVINNCRARVGNTGRKPLVVVLHNDYRALCLEVNPWIGVIYNSTWTASRYSLKNKAVICRPIPDMEDWVQDIPAAQVMSRPYVTLVNLNENKGGDILRQIAEALPGYEFLGVKGSYGTQLLRQPENVTVAENTLNMRSVYRSTRVVILPSRYESFGRVGLEAMASCIPVIATEVSREALGEAALYVERDDIQGWVRQIKMLQDPTTYRYLIGMGKRHVNEMIDQGEKDINTLEQFLTELKSKSYAGKMQGAA